MATTTNWVPQVSLVKDGTPVSASVVNPILAQLIAREQYLYDQFQNAVDLSVLTAFAQPIHPTEITQIVSGSLNAVYFASDNTGTGLKRAVVGFVTDPATTTFTAANSSYTFGIVSNVSTTGNADIWLEGLIKLPFRVDDPTNGLLQPVSVGVTETFRVGPYYLSQITPGKVTANPGGLAVLVGYGISPTEFLLCPNVDQLSALFQNYRFNVLDRPTAAPVLTSTTWTIPNSDMTRLGWVDITWLQSNNPSAIAAITVPPGAKFLYNVPSDYTTDNADNSGTDGVANGSTTFTSSSANFGAGMAGVSIVIASRGTYTIETVNSATSIVLSHTVATGTGLHYSIGSLFPYEQAEATELAALIPPSPADFNTLTVNGVEQIFRNVDATDGIYSIDNYGIWWYNDQTGTQPWAADLVSDWTPSDWMTTVVSDGERARIFLQFVRFNPAFNQVFITSLAPFNDGSTNNSTPSITFVDKNTGLPASVGDLFLKFNQSFNADVVAVSGNKALGSMVFDPVAGVWTRTTVPVVSSITGAPASGILVTESPVGSGQFLVSYQSQGVSGMCYDVTPRNAELVNLGGSLHSYIRLPYSALPIDYGLTGKIVLPKSFPYGKTLYIVLHVIGLSNVASVNVNVGFNLSYNVSTVLNGLAPASVVAANTTVAGAVLPNDTVVGVVNFALPSGYLAQQALKFQSTSLAIPAANIGEDSIVNFLLTRDFSGSNLYSGDIGVLATYWSLI
jgi:hypothetical protein